VSNLDFDGLRADVEAGTRVPDFDAVQRRAGRIRLRDRLLLTVAVVAALAVVVPLGVGVWRVWPGHRTGEIVGPDRPGPDIEEPTPTPTPSPTGSHTRGPAVAKVQAVGGVDLQHLYAAVDVCMDDLCSLEVSLVPMQPADRRPPLVVGQLRDKGTSRLDGVQLTPLGPTSLLLSGEPAGGARRYARVGVPRTAADFAGGASQPSPPQGAVRTLGAGDRAVQLQDYGQLYGARSVDDELTRLPAQPPLVAPTVAAGVAPADGWWVTGSDPDTDQLSVAISRDQGRTWIGQQLGVPSPDETPAVATRDGRTGYVFARVDPPGADGVAGWRTTDGGGTWQRIDAKLPPRPDTGGSTAPTKWNAVVRPDGSILLWSGDSLTPSYLESTDGGQSFHRTSGPSGRVVALSDGYATVNLPPAVSTDGRTWTPVVSPAYLPPA
jgi:hypothetical protein